MAINQLSAGKDIPNDFNVVIEISANNGPIKYEVDKDTGMLEVDRFLTTPMQYPCDYGFIPNTLSDDGDPADVLVISPAPIQPGSVVRCRPLGVLMMTDEKGEDCKILAAPLEKVCPQLANIQELSDVPETLVNSIKHFFEHYKDLEEGKWVKVDGWKDKQAACDEITKSLIDK